VNRVVSSKSPMLDGRGGEVGFPPLSGPAVFASLML